MGRPTGESSGVGGRGELGLGYGGGELLNLRPALLGLGFEARIGLASGSS